MVDKIQVQLKLFNQDLLEKIWQLGFVEEQPEWKQWDGPYFNDYEPYDSFENFLNSSESQFFMRESVKCILVNGRPVGIVSSYWESEKTRWLNIGIIIFKSEYWNRGIGTQALSLWIDELFNTYSELEHIGLVTWSGNFRMMKAAEKLGMKQEARIRKVRYWNDHYYDSVSYGILREEWE